MRERGHAQTIATPARSELGRRARQMGFEVVELSWADLRARLKRVDLLHTHTGRAQNMAWFASLGTARTPVKRVATRHVAFAPRHPLVHLLKYAWTCDGVIAVSQAVLGGMVIHLLIIAGAVNVNCCIEGNVELT